MNGSFVLGFDHDGPEVFERTVAWIEANRLECATFHLLTPYPGTPLFKQLDAENRVVHRDWGLYDTAHVVFEPARMSAEELQAGYEWCYRRLFSHASIWRRRPEDWRAVLPYLAMSYLYKRSNRIWHWLIRFRLTARDLAATDRAQPAQASRIPRSARARSRRGRDRHGRKRGRLIARPPARPTVAANCDLNRRPRGTLAPRCQPVRSGRGRADTTAYQRRGRGHSAVAASTRSALQSGATPATPRSPRYRGWPDGRPRSRPCRPSRAGARGCRRAARG